MQGKVKAFKSFSQLGTGLLGLKGNGSQLGVTGLEYSSVLLQQQQSAYYKEFISKGNQTYKSYEDSRPNYLQSNKYFFDPLRNVSTSTAQNQHITSNQNQLQNKQQSQSQSNILDAVDKQDKKPLSTAALALEAELDPKASEEGSLINFETPKGFTTKLLPNRYQSFLETIFALPSTQGLTGQYYGFIFTTFTLLFTHNMLLLIPGTPISAVFGSISLGLAVTVWMSTLFMGIGNFGINFLSYFLPSGSPVALYPIIIVIEIISYSLRAITLGVRLFANLLAGHALLKCLSGFVFLTARPELSVFASKTPFLQLGAVMGLVFAVFGIELLAAVLQAYVFSLLAAFYINDLVILDPKKHPPWINGVVNKAVARVKELRK